MKNKNLKLRSFFNFQCINFLNKFYFHGKRSNKETEIGKIHIIYRVSDAGYPKIKINNINNENCLKNAIQVFPTSIVDWNIICDNCSESTLSMIRKYLPEEKIQKVNIGHGAGTFNLAYDMALTFPDDDVVYFLENDYLHLSDSLNVLKDAFRITDKFDYVALYDHPDKYDINHPIFWYMEHNTRIRLGSIRHWKTAFSTTMTFATKVRTLKIDECYWREWTKGKHPYDYVIFMNLNRLGRKLWTPIPGVATHGETEYLGPLVEWEKI